MLKTFWELDGNLVKTNWELKNPTTSPSPPLPQMKKKSLLAHLICYQ